MENPPEGSDDSEEEDKGSGNLQGKSSIGYWCVGQAYQLSCTLLLRKKL